MVNFVQYSMNISATTWYAFQPMYFSSPTTESSDENQLEQQELLQGEADGDDHDKNAISRIIDLSDKSEQEPKSEDKGTSEGDNGLAKNTGAACGSRVKRRRSSTVSSSEFEVSKRGRWDCETELETVFV